MQKGLTFLLALTSFWTVSASWYWPFGSDSDEPEPPRLSDLIEPASLYIDEASDFAAEGKTDEAVEAYRKALAELDKVEAENPDRASTPEFASIRNKRAYISAAVDSLLLAQAHANAKAVAVTDTTELERKLAERRGEAAPKALPAPTEESGPRSKSPSTPAKRGKKKASPLAQIGAKVRAGQYEEAERALAARLVERPNDPGAMNLLALSQMMRGDTPAAEKTLDAAIANNPRDYHAYYNMVNLVLQTRGEEGLKTARYYYDTGRAVGGPKDAAIEEALK